jgi:hypothetical protein
MTEANTFEEHYYQHLHCRSIIKIAKKNGKTEAMCELLTSDYQDLLRKEGFKTDNEICRMDNKYYKQTKVSWLK